MHVRRSAGVLLAAWSLTFAGCAPTEWIRYSDVPPLNGDSGESRVQGEMRLRVVDVNGEPIAGAEAFASYEENFPMAGEFWHRGHGISDEHGLVSMKVSGHSNLLLVRAEGFADYAESAHFDDVIVLERAQRVPVRVVDWMGRPASGEIGNTAMCGHRPDVEVAQIGADGIAWFERLDDDDREIYPRCPGLADEYTEVPSASWHPGLPPSLIRLYEAPPVVGRLVDRDGKPMDGVHVGGFSQHRGPWTRTDADGRFRLDFLPPHDVVQLAVPGESERRFLGTPPRTGLHTFRLEDALTNGETSSRTGTVRFRAIRSDGSMHIDPDDLDPPTEPVEVMEWSTGVHVVQLGGSDAFESDDVVVAVVEGETTDCTLHVRERPTVRFAVRGDAECSVELVGRTWARDVTGLAGQPIPVPCDGQAAFWIEARCFPLPADFATRTEPIELVPPTTWVVGRLLDEHGAPVQGVATLGDDSVTTGTDGRFRLLADGGVELSLRSIGAEKPQRSLSLYLPVGQAENREHDVGDIRLWRMRPLRFFAADGTELTEGRVRLWRDGRPLGGRDGIQVHANHEGWPFDGPEPRAGDEAEFEFHARDADLATPLRQRLIGPGPWELRESAGKVTFEVVDPDGTPLRAQLWHRKATMELDDATWTLRGLVAGQQLFAIAADGHRTATLQLMLRDGEHRTLRIELPRSGER